MELKPKKIETQPQVKDDEGNKLDGSHCSGNSDVENSKDDQHSGDLDSWNPSPGAFTNDALW
jgi:hypothetical protein